MKKLVLLFLILALTSICGCNLLKANNDTNSHADIIVRLPNGENAQSNTNNMPDSINKNDVTIEQPPSEPVLNYIGSFTSKKFHKNDCTYAKKIDEENCVLYETYNEFIENGYSPCKKCLNNSK